MQALADFFKSGGPFMYVNLFTSIVAIAIIVGATALGGSLKATFQSATDTYQAGVGAGGGEAVE